MIQANKLRIGNWVRSNLTKREFQITAEDIVYINIDPSVVSPIPLTEERLLNFGFEQKNGLICSFSIDVTGITRSKSEEISLSRNTDKSSYWYLYFRQGDNTEKSLFHKNDLVLLQRKLESVHQLQNLYFALTGQELILNQELPSTLLP
jgi:hypothetical protein